MLEPSKPVTLKMWFTPYPAVELQSDEGGALRPGSVILRHRHLKRQFTIVPSGSRPKPPALVPPRYSSQRTSTVAGPIIVPPATAPPMRPVAVAVASTSAALPRAGTTTSDSAAAVPPSAHSSTLGPHIVTTPLTAPLSASKNPASAGGGAGFSTSSPLVPPIIAAAETSPAIHGPARRNNSRSHEIVKTNDSSLVVRRGQHAIRDKKGKTTWFYSDGQTYLLEPPVIHTAQPGDLYVHTASNRDLQIWIFSHNSQWEKIQLYHPHPVLSGYVLHVVRDGEPRWIQKSTVTTYKGREKRYQQMAFRGEAEAALVTWSGQAARHRDAV